ncbi:MAG: tetratricopeptide repeat protein [Candidatus Obscuribacterales bacterium]|nr:tetratricopeptide repeat protein [Candidatus Obscuribacterales bacterium]
MGQSFLCFSKRTAVWLLASATTIVLSGVYLTQRTELVPKIHALLDQAFDKATLTYFDIVISINPNNSQAYIERSLVNARAQKYERVLEDSDKAIALDPKLTLPYSMKAEAYEQLRKYQKEIEECNKVIAIDPKTFRYYIFRATAHRELGQYQKALQDCNIALSLASQKAMPYIHRGYVYACLNKFQNAVQDYTAAIEIDLSSTEAYSLRAYSYGKLGQYQKQIDDLTLAAKINTSDASLYEQRSDAYKELGQYQKQIDDLSLAVNLSPQNTNLYEKRGYAYYKLGKITQAIEDYGTAINMHPQSAEAYLLRSDAYRELGQYQKQIDNLTLAVNISPKSDDLFERRGYAYYKLGKFRKAIDDCTTAIAHNPYSLDAYSTAALAYEVLGLYDQAVELRTKILELKTSNAIDWSNRAKDYELLGQFDLAQADMRKAIELASATERATLQLCNPFIDIKKLSGTVEWPRNQIDKLLKGNPIVLSFHFDDEDHICLPAKVNSQSLELMLDTGCAHSNLWNKAMSRIAKVDNTQLRNKKANGKEYSYGFFKARKIKLGTLLLQNVAMSIREGLVGHKTLSGLLGGNILEQFVVTIDYEKKQTIIATSFINDRSKKLVIVPMRLRNHCPYCMVCLDGKLELMAMLDTGCPLSMSADSLVQSLLPRKLDYKQHISGPWLGSLSSEKVQMKSLRVGSANFKQPSLEVFPAAEAPAAAFEIILGNDFLSKFKTVTFDYRGKRIIFEPNNHRD